jgi:DNA-binding LacI/PurR family transcriptional regulator
MTDVDTGASRGSAGLVEALREAMTRGAYSAGQFVPSLRKLGELHGVSQETVRRGLRVLVQQGLLVAEPRRGFRVVRSTAEMATQCPVAYVTSNRGADLNRQDEVARVLGSAIQDAAAIRGWSVLVAHVGGQSDQIIAEKLRVAGAWGVALDTLDPALLTIINRLGLPVVMVNAWEETIKTDAVLQDNYLGGFLAARHLVESGAREIAWIGPRDGHCHARQRYAGAVAGLRACGRELDPKLCLYATGEELGARTRKLLSSGRPPDGVLALWTVPAQVVIAASEELGLTPEKDFRMVGWCVEELYESRYAALFRGGKVPAAITWKAETMANRALTALAERRMQPGGDVARVDVAVRLCPAKEELSDV